MSQENVELVKTFFALFPRHVDSDAFAGLLAPDAELHPPRAGLHGRVIEGAAAIQAFWASEFSETWDASRSSDQLDEIFDLGDRVAVVVRSHGVGQLSGAAVESRGGGVFDLRGGQIVRIRIFSSRAEVLEAAGLSE